MPQQPTDPDLADFLDECGWQPSTLTIATSILCRWERGLAGRQPAVAPLDADHRALRAWLAERDAAGIGPATRHKDWQTIRAFYKWAARPIAASGPGLLAADPMLRVGAPTIPDGAGPRVATAAEVFALEQYFAGIAQRRRAGGEAQRARRNAAMVSLMFRSGLRVGELPWIDVDHLVRNPKGAVVACVVGGGDGARTKSGKTRLVPVVDETPKLLERYLRVRGAAPGPLFRGRDAHTASPDGRLTAIAVKLVVGRAAKAVGVPISSHQMRRGWTVESRRRGVDPVTIQTLAGWSRSTGDKMLRRYFGPEENQVAVDTFHAAISEKTSRDTLPRLRAVD